MLVAVAGYPKEKTKREKNHSTVPSAGYARLSLQGSSIQVNAGPASRWLGDDLAAELACK